MFCKDLAKFQITTYDLQQTGIYIYSFVNMNYIHVPQTLIYTRRKQSLLANTISRVLKHLGTQPQTGKVLEISIYIREKFAVSKTHKKTHTHTKTCCETFWIDLITISK